MNVRSEQRGKEERGYQENQELGDVAREKVLHKEVLGVGKAARVSRRHEKRIFMLQL